jgi:hypothetical protein
MLSAAGFRYETPHGTVRRINRVDVALIMNQVKVARLTQTPDSKDGWIDGAGYMAIGGELALEGF